MDNDKAIRAAKLTLGGMLEKKRAKSAVERAQGQIAPSKYLPGVPRQVHADGGRVLPDGYSLHVDKNRFGVLARYNGQNVAQLTLKRDRDTGKMSAFQMAVHPSHQRMGLMSAMHDAAEKQFGPIEPDETLTDEGFSFWKKYRPDAVSNRLRYYQDSLLGKPVKTPYGEGTVKSVGDRGMMAELDGKDGATAWARAKSVPDMLRENGVDPDKITYADGGAVSKNLAKFIEGNHPEVPHVLYHATQRDFSTFKKGRSVQANFNNAQKTLGHFFTDDPEYANQYVSGWDGYKENASVMPVHLSMKNPKIEDISKINEIENEWSVRQGAMYRKQLEDMGHDGIIFKGTAKIGPIKEFVAFHPHQIKSAIGNSGDFDPESSDITKADGGEVAPDAPPPVDLGQVREQKQLQTFHTGMMGDVNTRMTQAMEAHQKAVDAGHFDGYEVGDVLQGSKTPMRITGRYVQQWKPTRTTLDHFDRMGAKPTIIEHEGKQYIPMLRYQTGKEGEEGFQDGSAYLDGIKAAGYQKMGGLRVVKARGGAVGPEFEKWFAGSKVKHPDGRPMLMVHASPNSDIKAFRRNNSGGIWFSPAHDTSEADIVASDTGRGTLPNPNPDQHPDVGVGATYYPVHLAIKNPARGELADDFYNGGETVQSLKRKGYDGVAYDDDVHVAFDPHQIKSPFNQGTFDPTNPDMTYADGGMVPAMSPQDVTARSTQGEEDPLLLIDQTLDNINNAGRLGSVAGKMTGVPLGGMIGRQIAENIAASRYNNYADGGSVAERSPMFEGMSEHLLDEGGKPAELWHGTPGQPFEAFDDAKLGVRDAGFFGRGHYLTPDRGVADAYADPDEMGRGSVMGPLHAALKNPYVWDVSDEQKSHSTLRDLQSMGIMKGQGKIRPWDNLQRHHIDPFMKEVQRRGHDGVIYKTDQGVKEIVVFKPTAIKHRDAEVGDPNDPRIMRADGGKVDLYSKAARVLGGLKDQPMQVEDIIKYALGKGVKRAEIDYTDPPRGGMARPSQVAQHIADTQPQIGVQRREAPGEGFRFGSDREYEREVNRLQDRRQFDAAEDLMTEWEQFGGYGGESDPRYAQHQLPGGQNYREHILTLDNHQGQTYTAPMHWGNTPNPLAHIRMSDRMIGNKKILHIEELQSDWNNDARKKGFSTGTERQDYENFVSQMRQKAIDKVKARTGQDYYDPVTGETAPTMSPMVAQAQIEKYKNMDPYMLAMKMRMQEEHRTLARKTDAGNIVPRAPYINPDRDDASELAMKHVLTEAAKGGYDGISFTPDAAQSDRWKGTNFNGIYDRKLPSMAQRLVRQHDIQGGSTENPQSIGGYDAPHVELTDKARQGILQNGFSSFRRGGYVTHVRRMR